MTMIKGLNAILSSGVDYLTFEDGKSKVLLFIDWGEDVAGVREHYEPALNPRYIRCPGKEVCPLCQANPGKIPAFKVKFRVYDPTDGKVKIVSLAKSHIQKLHQDFSLDEVDPTKNYVIIYRTGKHAHDTIYSARLYRPDPTRGWPEYAIPNRESLDMPDLMAHVTPHSPEEILRFMQALLNVETGEETEDQIIADQYTVNPQPEIQTPPQNGTFQQPMNSQGMMNPLGTPPTQQGKVRLPF